jgi:hypothetical protein
MGQETCRIVEMTIPLRKALILLWKMVFCGVCRIVGACPLRFIIFFPRVHVDFDFVAVYKPANTAKWKFAREINGLQCGIVENTILQVRHTILQV